MREMCTEDGPSMEERVVYLEGRAHAHDVINLAICLGIRKLEIDTHDMRKYVADALESYSSLLDDPRVASALGETYAEAFQESLDQFLEGLRGNPPST